MPANATTPIINVRISVWTPKRSDGSDNHPRSLNGGLPFCGECRSCLRELVVERIEMGGVDVPAKVVVFICASN